MRAAPKKSLLKKLAVLVAVSRTIGDRRHIIVFRRVLNFLFS
jgi:hypothetical protein